ncbi:hypothetical protein BB558_004010 [Smittium angustum]|uniref:Uncharacterized protein n=1 Tax=Smittium angustum TaxID=133377 RepID=A0A2U1J4J8_SMIAN|nr:hypothetical protein BB558_004010 [Smittium angustum]
MKSKVKKEKVADNEEMSIQSNEGKKEKKVTSPNRKLSKKQNPLEGEHTLESKHNKSNRKLFAGNTPPSSPSLSPSKISRKSISNLYTDTSLPSPAFLPENKSPKSTQKKPISTFTLGEVNMHDNEDLDFRLDGDVVISDESSPKSECNYNEYKNKSYDKLEFENNEGYSYTKDFDIVENVNIGKTKHKTVYGKNRYSPRANAEKINDSGKHHSNKPKKDKNDEKRTTGVGSVFTKIMNSPKLIGSMISKSSFGSPKIVSKKIVDDSPKIPYDSENLMDVDKCENQHKTFGDRFGHKKSREFSSSSESTKDIRKRKYNFFSARDRNEMETPRADTNISSENSEDSDNINNHMILHSRNITRGRVVKLSKGRTGNNRNRNSAYIRKQILDKRADLEYQEYERNPPSIGKSSHRGRNTHSAKAGVNSYYGRNKDGDENNYNDRIRISMLNNMDYGPKSYIQLSRIRSPAKIPFINQLET